MKRQNWVIALVLVVVLALVLSQCFQAVYGIGQGVDLLGILRQLAEPGYSIF